MTRSNQAVMPQSLLVDRAGSAFRQWSVAQARPLPSRPFTLRRRCVTSISLDHLRILELDRGVEVVEVADTRAHQHGRSAEERKRRDAAIPSSHVRAVGASGDASVTSGR
jgi:hypothetical protein